MQDAQPVGQVLHCIVVAFGYVPSGQLVESTQVPVFIFRYFVKQDVQNVSFRHVAH